MKTFLKRFGVAVILYVIWLVAGKALNSAALSTALFVALVAAWIVLIQKIGGSK